MSHKSGDGFPELYAYVLCHPVDKLYLQFNNVELKSTSPQPPHDTLIISVNMKPL